jgi:hypothetical protein
MSPPRRKFLGVLWKSGFLAGLVEPDGLVDLAAGADDELFFTTFLLGCSSHRDHEFLSDRPAGAKRLHAPFSLILVDGE